jgi:predicted transcriptional regulator
MTDQHESKFISDRQTAILGVTRDIVCAALHPDSGAVVTDALDLLDRVHAKVTALVDGRSVAPSDLTEKPTAAQIKKSITPDHLISFEDGKPYKTLRRHLTLRGLTPEQYRAKHGLPGDYPMTSALYSAQRSELARTMGLGQMRRKDAEPPAPPAPAPKPARRAKALEAA